MDIIPEGNLPERDTLTERAVKRMEQIRGIKIQEVEPEKDFYPFAESGNSKLVLLRRGLTRVLIEIKAKDLNILMRGRPYFSPIDRSVGYSADERDYKSDEEKEAKYNEFVKANPEGPGDKDLYPLSVRVSDQLRFVHDQKEEDAWAGQVKQTLENIELRVRIGGFSFRSRIEQHDEFGSEWLRFHEFYPDDLGHFAVDPYDRGEGMEIVAPDNPEELKHIQMRFIIAPKKTAEDKINNEASPE